jgi:hypothetical protein
MSQSVFFTCVSSILLSCATVSFLSAVFCVFSSAGFFGASFLAALSVVFPLFYFLALYGFLPPVVSQCPDTLFFQHISCAVCL